MSSQPQWESWALQLQETATLVAKMLRTCAFCGIEGSPFRPVKLCRGCRCPTCDRCLTFTSETPDGPLCHHAPVARR